MDWGAIRREFPITEVTFPVVGGDVPKPLIYFDQAASTHPSRRVLNRYTSFLEREYANIHRGNHHLSLVASEMFDHAVESIARFIGGDLKTHCVIMTPNTTEALNLASHVMSRVEGITLGTWMEHHSNDLSHRQHGQVEHVEITADGELDLADLEAKLKRFKVKLVAVTGASNVTGAMPDIHRIAGLAHRHGARILVDAAQLLAHQTIQVDSDAIDFLAAAGHKAYAPFGSGFLYAPRDLLDHAIPFMPGGGTVVDVTEGSVQYKESPDRHQGGTPNIAGAVAFAESLRFLEEIGLSEIRAHEKELLKIALSGLQALEGVTVYGPREAEKRLGVIAFNIQGIPHDLVSAILNYEGAIATRNGRFCAHPYVYRLLSANPPGGEDGKPRLPGTVRASFGVYNTVEEVEEFLRRVRLIRDRQWKGSYRLGTVDTPSPVTTESREPIFIQPGSCSAS